MIEFGHVTLTANGAGSRTVTAQLRLVGSEGADNAAEPVDGAEVVQPLGLISRPQITATTEAAYVRVGDEIIVLGILDKGAFPLDVEEGETRLYGAKDSAARVRCRKDGSLNVDSDLFAEKSIRLNLADGDPGLNVARETDPVDCGKLQVVTTSGAPTAFTIQYFDADNLPVGAPATVALGTNATVNLPMAGGKIIDGAVRVKA